jgi:hypothetical protein
VCLCTLQARASFLKTLVRVLIGSKDFLKSLVRALLIHGCDNLDQCSSRRLNVFWRLGFEAPVEESVAIFDVLGGGRAATGAEPRQGKERARRAVTSLRGSIRQSPYCSRRSLPHYRSILRIRNRAGSQRRNRELGHISDRLPVRHRRRGRGAKGLPAHRGHERVTSPGCQY